MKTQIRAAAILTLILAGIMAFSGGAYAMGPGGDGPDGGGTGPVGNVGTAVDSNAGKQGDGAVSINTDALGMDARSYAADFGVPVQEAKRRLTLQGSVGSLQEDLVDSESDTFGGLWIQHEPVFRIVARFTQDGESTVRPYVSGGLLSGLVDVQTADATLNDLRAAQEKAMTTAGALGVAVESDIDVIGNRVKLFVVDRAGLDSSLAAPDVELPDEVDIVTVNELSQVTANLHAGLSTIPCTAGFSVVHSDGRRGITTAAHCEPDISFNGTALNFVEGYLGGKYDVQWHKAPTFRLRGLMYDGTNYRYVHGTKHRDDQAVGEYVCRYGKKTFYGCGTIFSTYVQPSNKKNCFSNCSFEATFVLVLKTSGILVEEGDSGGPWFSNNTAYGIMRARGTTPNEAVGEVYMAINYVSVLGVSVITEQ